MPTLSPATDNTFPQLLTSLSMAKEKYYQPPGVLVHLCNYLFSTLYATAYIVGSTNKVSTVATSSPLEIATAIGPQKELAIKGIIPKIAAAAVSMMGRKRKIAESTTAS